MIVKIVLKFKCWYNLQKGCVIMENKIVIQNFGPVKEAQINLNKKFQIFIGAQASGKSTICKVVYFVQNIEENISFV